MPKVLTALRLDPDLLAAMRHVKASDGIPIAVQVDFALRQWLAARGALKTSRTKGTKKGV